MEGNGRELWVVTYISGARPEISANSKCETVQHHTNAVRIKKKKDTFAVRCFNVFSPEMTASNHLLLFFENFLFFFN